MHVQSNENQHTVPVALFSYETSYKLVAVEKAYQARLNPKRYRTPNLTTNGRT